MRYIVILMGDVTAHRRRKDCPRVIVPMQVVRLRLRCLLLLLRAQQHSFYAATKT